MTTTITVASRETLSKLTQGFDKVLVQEIRTSNSTNGNPRKLAVILSPYGDYARTLAVVKLGYLSLRCAKDLLLCSNTELPQVRVAPKAYNAMLKQHAAKLLIG